MVKNDDQLDQALQAYISEGERDEQSLKPYAEVLKALEVLRDVPERTADQHSAGREFFLQQARSSSPPVSAEPKSRLKWWKNILRWERIPMTSVMGILLAIVVAFGGLGTAAVAAQDSLPTEPLYAVKQLTEELRYGLTIDQDEKANLLLEFLDERVREMEGLFEEGKAIPQQTALRLETHLQLALQVAAELDDDGMIRTLTRLRQITHSHLLTMEQLRQLSPEDESLQLATRAMIQANRAAEDGLEDPVTFRNRQGTNRPEDAPEQPENMSPGDEGSGGSNGDGPGPGPGDGDGNSSQGQGDSGGDGGSGQGQGDGGGSGAGNSGQENGAGINGGSGKGK